MEIRGIYLDYNATTPVDPRVAEKMFPYFSEIFGNPSNGFHRQGRLAAQAVITAREQVSSMIGAEPHEIVFTSGATESNNQAILGLAHLHINNARKRIVTSKIEHKAILNPLKKLSEEGFEIISLDVDSQGVVSIEQATQFIDEKTLLVSVHLANNEIGTIQPVQAIAEIAHKYGVLVHSDAAQAVGKIPVNVQELGVDLLSMSAHKLYGPKGIGALFIRNGIRGIPMEPLLYGGGQENGFRSGTTNVSGIVGFGEAARISKGVLTEEMIRISTLRDHLEEQLSNEIPNLIINAQKAQRLPNTSSLIFLGVEADALLFNLPDVMLGTGSACTSGTIEPSHVLQAIGISREDASAMIRVSLGRYTSESDIRQACNSLVEAVFRLMSKS